MSPYNFYYRIFNKASVYLSTGRVVPIPRIFFSSILNLCQCYVILLLNCLISWYFLSDLILVILFQVTPRQSCASSMRFKAIAWFIIYFNQLTFYRAIWYNTKFCEIIPQPVLYCGNNTNSYNSYSCYGDGYKIVTITAIAII